MKLRLPITARSLMLAAEIAVVLLIIALLVLTWLPAIVGAHGWIAR